MFWIIPASHPVLEAEVWGTVQSRTRTNHPTLESWNIFFLFNIKLCSRYLLILIQCLVDISVGGYKFYTFFIWVSREISLLRHIMIHWYYIKLSSRGRTEYLFLLQVPEGCNTGRGLHTPHPHTSISRIHQRNTIRDIKMEPR